VKHRARAYVHRDFPRIPVKRGVLGGAAPGFLVAALPVGVRAREKEEKEREGKGRRKEGEKGGGGKKG
jgi:hypothetical protein